MPCTRKAAGKRGNTIRNLFFPLRNIVIVAAAARQTHQNEAARAFAAFSRCRSEALRKARYPKEDMHRRRVAGGSR
ncbi:hypothetical protein BAY1663_05028 [Pseudomonas sp. BAY1663]|nr:hypothetical protein BAY1663_05028 [Pseudomonas sp. BAY1663]